MAMGQLIVQRYHPFGPFWGARSAEEYVHTRRHTLEKKIFRQNLLAVVLPVLPPAVRPKCLVHEFFILFAVNLSKRQGLGQLVTFEK